jgi:hypothetical protein
MTRGFDIAPAHVTVGGVLYTKARVVVNDGRIHIIAAKQGTPTLLASATITDCLPCNSGPLNMITVEDGTKFEVRRGGGCSCGANRAIRDMNWREFVTAAGVEA